ncbi:ATP synthase F1 subunit gamma [Acholeplasma granularum]|uniref:ATP synthase F1 subunit gamma n=1 Tax=Acholeplasma granularum TaxID=264635 RepID=UPI0004721400|nr:ATP synthase F1 subunit gamma [Acholeplasma granularum]
MANLQVLKSRIVSIEKTASITKAMYQIASSKLVSAQNAFTQYNQFKSAFDEVLNDVFKTTENNIFLNKDNRSKNKLFIIISTDRGLVGAYNQQLFKQFLDHIKDMDKNNVFVIAIGRRAFAFTNKEKLNRLNQEVILNHDDVNEATLGDYIDDLVELYVNNYYGEISVFSNKFINSMTQKPENEILLPIDIKSKVNQIAHDPYFYEGSKTDTLNDLIMIYIQSRLYGLLVDAKLSEYSSRIMAMKSATDNANEALEKLSLKYHQARQHKITNELLDISNSKL